MKLFFPDSYWQPDLLSGSAFLYFNKEKLSFALPPSSTAFLSGASPRDFFGYVDAQSPIWKDKFARFVQLSSLYRVSFGQTTKLIEPLRSDFSTILLSYSRDDGAWERGQPALQTFS